MLAQASLGRLLIGAALLVAAPAAAQTPPPSDAPTQTARSIDTPAPPAKPGDPTPPPPPVNTTAPTQLATDTPGDADTTPTPRFQQLFISPMGEPFRAEVGQPYPVETWFKQADTDHDGAISLAEFKADAARFFKVLDANGDGVVDGFEVGDYETKIAPEILPQVQNRLAAQDVMSQRELAQSGNRRRKAEDSAGKGRKERKGTLQDAMTGAAQYGLLAEPEPVRGADANLDFKISLAEWMSAAGRRFGELDKNHDGKLQRAELPITPMQRMLIDRAKEEAKAAGKK
jgi:hypothetical protein